MINSLDLNGARHWAIQQEFTLKVRLGMTLV
jgi:hypothetical protein